MTTDELLLLSWVRKSLATGEAVGIREAARLTQTDVANAIGVTPATVSRWESGSRVTPRSSVALAYAHLLRELKGAAA